MMRNGGEVTSGRRGAALTIVVLGGLGLAHGKFTTPDCPDFQSSEFRYVKVVTKTEASDPSLAGPVKLDFDRQADGKVDIWFIERAGKVKVWNAARGQVNAAGQVSVTTAHEGGLVGLALHPDFRKNNWIYLFYTPTGQSVFKLTRYQIVNGVMDMKTAKDLLVIPNGMTVSKHTGGAMDFDAYGDLWLTIGNNSPDQPELVSESNWEMSAEASAGNPSDLRGSVLRIHPDDSPKGYSIPAGNFGEYWSKQFAGQGKAALAAEYADPAKVLPEIYVKGTRSPYSINVDPFRRWLTWGEFGPFPRTEEHNLVTHPAFAGYPWFAGNQTAVLKEPYLTQSGGPKDPAAPVNNSKWNKGPRQLPPADPAFRAYHSHGGTSGPIYRYDGDLQSPVKFPPHFDKAWFVTDYSWTGAMAIQLNEAGDRTLDTLSLFNSFGFAQPLDFKQGPDGALYTVNYGGAHSGTASTHIGRIEYTGSCRPALPKLPTVPTTLGSAQGDFKREPAIQVDAAGIALDWDGGYKLVLRDLSGREIYRNGVSGKAFIPRDRLPDGTGVYILEIHRLGQGVAGFESRRIKVVLPKP